MFAKYKNSYFNVSEEKGQYRIWCFQPVDGFASRITRGGNRLYEKVVSLHDIERLFDVGFSVNFDGQWCGSSYNPVNNLLALGTNDRAFALAHNMEEDERGVYYCVVPFETFSEFRVRERDYITKEESYRMVSPEEFKRLWKLLRTDLIPPRG